MSLGFIRILSCRYRIYFEYIHSSISQCSLFSHPPGPVTCTASRRGSSDTSNMPTQSLVVSRHMCLYYMSYTTAVAQERNYPCLEEDERQAGGRHCQPSSVQLSSAWALYKSEQHNPGAEPRCNQFVPVCALIVCEDKCLKACLFICSFLFQQTLILQIKGPELLTLGCSTFVEAYSNVTGGSLVFQFLASCVHTQS